MRRHWVVALAVLTLLGVLSPPVWAQAPTPRVTITGVIDNLVNFNRNSSMNDIGIGGITKSGDDEMYGRTRGRFDIIGELGKAKAVLGLEVDLVYGQVSGAAGGAAAPCVGGGSATGGGVQRPGTTCGFAADNDTVGVFEIKWMYVEFPLSGPGSLLPFVPWAGTMTVGGQPYALGLPPSILADSDFAGATIRMTLTPTLKASLTYAQLEEALTGPRFPGAVATAGINRFGRGDDWGIILKADWQATKELRVSPIYAFQEISGTTSALVRRAAGGYPVGAANFAPDTTLAGVPTPCLGSAIGGLVNIPRCQPTEESRHWIGADARWARGPWYVAPTFFYQWGNRNRFPTLAFPAGTAGGLVGTSDPGVDSLNPRRETAYESAWIADFEVGHRGIPFYRPGGPLFLQLRGMFTSGNKASDNLNKEIRYYQPFQTGNSYYIGWGEAHGIGSIDYLTALYSFSGTFSESAQIGYDRYGRAQFTVKASYDITPTITPYLMVTPMWTARSVPTRRGFLTATGIVCLDDVVANRTTPTGHICDRSDKGDQNYLGTDVTVGFTYRFAPGLTFDWVYGVLVAGDAYDTNRFHNFSTAGVGLAGSVRKHDSQNVYVTTARVRYAF